MKILHTVESYSPSVGGMQEVVRQLSERLSSFGHTVIVATSKHRGRREFILNGVEIREFDISGSMVRGYKGAVSEIDRYQAYLKSDFDVVVNFAAQQWATDLALPILADIKAKRVFVPTGFSGLYLGSFRDYFKKMPDWMRKYSMNVFLSNSYRDICFARDNQVNNVCVIPNGAASEEFEPAVDVDIRELLGIPQNARLIIHVGSHTGLKGHREAIRIFSEADITDAALVIIGNSFGRGCAVSCRMRSWLGRLSSRNRKDNKRIYVVDFDRRTTVAAYQQADLFLFPSNVECSPIVLFEAMASRTPFLTTEVGNAAEIVEWSSGGVLLPTIKGESGFVEADIYGSVKMLECVMNDRTLRTELAEAGYRSWHDRFTWDSIAKKYEALYASLI